jgi:hypothetical protein
LRSIIEQNGGGEGEMNTLLEKEEEIERKWKKEGKGIKVRIIN